MSSARFFVLVLSIALFALSFLPGFAHSQQAQPSAKPAPPSPPPAPKADPKADQTFKQLLEQLDPKKLGWVETTFWQQSELQGASLLAEGRYLLGPNHRLRMELKVTLGKIQGELLSVCDGTTVWDRMRVGKEEGVAKWDLKAAQAALVVPGGFERLAEEFYKTKGFLSLEPLLQNLRQQMVFTKQENARWQHRDVLKLTGVWTEEIGKRIAATVSGNAPWPPFVPQKCHLYISTLEGKILWPYRLEWWGPAAFRGEESLLVHMEFRDPKLLKADAKAPDYVKACTFDPGDAKVLDQTGTVTQHISQSRNRLMQQPLFKAASEAQNK